MEVDQFYTLSTSNGPKCICQTFFLAHLHLLHVKYRIDFVILLFINGALNGFALQYVTDLQMLYSAPRSPSPLSQLSLLLPTSLGIVSPATLISYPTIDNFKYIFDLAFSPF